MQSRSELPALDTYFLQHLWQLFWLLEKNFSGIINSWRQTILHLNDTDLIYIIYAFVSLYLSSAVVVLMLIINTKVQIQFSSKQDDTDSICNQIHAMHCCFILKCYFHLYFHT